MTQTPLPLLAYPPPTPVGPCFDCGKRSVACVANGGAVLNVCDVHRETRIRWGWTEQVG